MSEPYSETIIQSVMTALGTISTGAGDNFTPKAVVRRDRIDFIQPDAIQVAWAGESKETSNDGPVVPRYGASLSLKVISALADAPADPDATDRQASLRARDIEKALLSVNWASLDAVLAVIDATQFRDLEEELPLDGIVVDLEIRYQVDSDDTTQVLDYASK